MQGFTTCTSFMKFQTFIFVISEFNETTVHFISEEKYVGQDFYYKQTQDQQQTDIVGLRTMPKVIAMFKKEN